MESVKNPIIEEPLNVLVVGNNPIEIGSILDNLHNISFLKVVPEIAFDLPSALQRLLHFRPNFILVDDNLDPDTLHEVLHRFSRNRKTKHVPIAILKNSNYKETVSSVSVLDYVLKQNLTPIALYSALKNSKKYRRTQLLLYQTYQKRILLGFKNLKS